MKYQSKSIHFHARKCIWKCRLENGGQLVSASMYWYFTIQGHHLPNCVYNPYDVLIQYHTLRPRQNGRHFPDIFKWIFLNENIGISINISPKFVPRGPINNIPTLVQVMAWRRPGDKPLSEPMMVRLPTHIWVTRPQWVNDNLWMVYWEQHPTHEHIRVRLVSMAEQGLSQWNKALSGVMINGGLTLFDMTILRNIDNDVTAPNNNMIKKVAVVHLNAMIRELFAPPAGIISFWAFAGLIIHLIPIPGSIISLYAAFGWCREWLPTTILSAVDDKCM